jgi:hypothetical protein
MGLNPTPAIAKITIVCLNVRLNRVIHRLAPSLVSDFALFQPPTNTPMITAIPTDPISQV